MTHMPNIQGDTWFNTKPLSTKDLEGKVVLVDFWTYSCVNCLRTMPYLKTWWNKYGDRSNFILIGVHTPEFEFEKEPGNVEKAIEDIGISWPVVLDNDKKVWDAFANRFWPAKYLIDEDGNIIYQHFGEGHYKETENKIQEALGLEGEDASKTVKEEHEHGNVCFTPTPETYCGYTRGELANKEGYRKSNVFDYERPHNMHDSEIGLEGKFVATPEYVEPREQGATLHLRFHATEVNLVLHRETVEETTVRIFLNDKEIILSKTGDDVGKQGIVIIDKPKMYNLVRSEGMVDGTISIQAEKGRFQAYAFTFSGCEHSKEKDES